MNIAELVVRTGLLAVPLALAACGGTTSGVSQADVQAFRADAQVVSSAATTYGTQAATMTSSATCNSAQGAYDDQVRPMIGRMQGMGTSMDGMMGSMNHMGDGDMECTANAMMAELDRHGGAACASTTDMAPNVAEAQSHVARMTGWATHQMERAQEMGSMMGMSGMMGGAGGTGTATGHCVRNADGSYTFQP